jgi:hypothetical protein
MKKEWSYKHSHVKLIYIITYMRMINSILHGTQKNNAYF